MWLFAGIDVAKDTLAVALSSGQEWSCANDARGIALLVERLEAANPALVVLEATGGYEEELLAALIAAGIETRRVNPREVHHFARAAGQLAKTDRIDARMLALFAERNTPASAGAVRPRARATQGAGRPPQPVAADDYCRAQPPRARPALVGNESPTHHPRAGARAEADRPGDRGTARPIDHSQAAARPNHQPAGRLPRARRYTYRAGA